MIKKNQYQVTDTRETYLRRIALNKGFNKLKPMVDMIMKRITSSQIDEIIGKKNEPEA